MSRSADVTLSSPKPGRLAVPARSPRPSPPAPTRSQPLERSGSGSGGDNDASEDRPASAVRLRGSPKLSSMRAMSPRHIYQMSPASGLRSARASPASSPSITPARPTLVTGSSSMSTSLLSPALAAASATSRARSHSPAGGTVAGAGSRTPTAFSPRGRSGSPFSPATLNAPSLYASALSGCGAPSPRRISALAREPPTNADSAAGTPSGTGSSASGEATETETDAAQGKDKTQRTAAAVRMSAEEQDQDQDQGNGDRPHEDPSGDCTHFLTIDVRRLTIHRSNFVLFPGSLS